MSSCTNPVYCKVFPPQRVGKSFEEPSGLSDKDECGLCGVCLERICFVSLSPSDPDDVLSRHEHLVSQEIGS